MARIAGLVLVLLATTAVGAWAQTNEISAVSPAGTISPATPTLSVPVTITRSSGTPAIMGFSVILTVSSNMSVLNGKDGIVKGDFLGLGGNSNTSLMVIDRGSGVWQVDGTTNGTPCGVTATSGTLFTIPVQSPAASGPGTVTITSVRLRDCTNQQLASTFATAATVQIDNAGPAVTVTAPNGGETWYVGSTQNVTWTATDAATPITVDLAYSTDGGLNFTAIQAGLANSGTYAWTVPAVVGPVLVKATAHDNLGNVASDVSDGSFTSAYVALTVTPAGNGHVNRDLAGPYPYGQAVQLTAVADPGWTFAGWGVDLSGTTNPETITMNGDKTVTATFTQDEYTLTVNVTGSGTVTKLPSQATYHYGDEVTLTAHPETGWAFVAFGGDVTGASPATITMNGSKTVTASFVALGVHNLATGLYYATIQAAIDDPLTLGTHTIQVAAGTFEEQVVVGKALTITGAGCGNTIIRSPVSLTQSFMTGTNVNKPIVLVNGVNATIQNLTIDGAGRGNSNARFFGLAFWNGGGKGANLCIQRVEDATFDSGSAGVGVYAYNDVSGSYSLELDHVTVTDFEKNGMALMGDGLTVNVHDCTVTGHGYTGVIAQNGIQAGFGATGAITACKVTDIGYTGPSWSASGFLIWSATGSMSVSNLKGANKIENVQVPFNWYSSNGTIDSVETTGGSDWGAIYVANVDEQGTGGLTTGPADGQRRMAKASPFDDELGGSNATTGTLATSYAVSVTNSCLYGSRVAGTVGINSDSWYGGGMDVTATGNHLQDWDTGLGIYAAPATLTAHDNSVTSSATAGYDGSANPTQNAERNWWGDAAGPSGSNQVLGADYTPWIHDDANLALGCSFTPPTYTIAASAGANGGISPTGTLTAYTGDDVIYTITANVGYGIADVVVDETNHLGAQSSYTFTNVTDNHTIAASFVALGVHNLTTNLYYATIQAAIDDPLTLDTHTIQVAAGTFEEQVVVGKALTITGAGCVNTIIRSPATLPQSFTAFTTIKKPIVFVNGVNATIQDLTIDGAGRGNSNAAFVGLAFFNGGGKGANLCIQHVEDTPFSGAQHGVGVYAYASGTARSLELDHVAVTDFQKNGMALMGDALTVNVHDCTTTGKSATDVNGQNGIQLSDGATGAITACKVTDIDYTGTTWAASGLLISDASGSVVISNMKGDNRIYNVQAPVNWYNSSGSIDGIEIANSARGAWQCGIYAYNSSSSLVASTTGAPSPGRERPALASPLEGGARVNNATSGTLATSYTLNVTNSCILGVDGTNTVAMGAYSPGGGMALIATNNTVQDWGFGFVYYGGTATLTAHENSIVSNTYGFYGSGTSDATRNWWGDASGPSGDGPGSGDGVYGATYDPWIHSGTNQGGGCSFTPPTYTLAASVTSGSGSVTPAGTTTAYRGDDVAYTIAPATGWHIVDVVVDGTDHLGAATSHTFTNVTVGHTIAAEFAISSYTVTYEGNGSDGGTVPAGGSYDFGTTVTVAGNSGSLVQTGHTFAGWNTLADGTGTPYAAGEMFTMPAAAVTLFAQWSINTYTLTYTAGTNGSILGTNPQHVTYLGSGSTVTAQPDGGYHFVSWSDGVLTAARTDVNVAADLSVVASFVINPVVPPPTLTVTQVTTGNGPGDMTKLNVGWGTLLTGQSVEIWRASYGHYPEYGDAAGTPVTTVPPESRWALIASNQTGASYTDTPAPRDYYYYAAIVTDEYGTGSAATVSSSLNYLLGDVTNGSLPLGVGDNKVEGIDVSLLGNHYGISMAANESEFLEFSYLDVGPTTTQWVTGIPTTDNVLEFEDLVMFALNYGTDYSHLLTLPLASATAGSDAIVLERPATVAMGSPVTVSLKLAGSGTLRALSTKLAWDPAVVEPVGHAVGAWLTAQNGVAFSAKPGTVDAAVMNTSGLTGEGLLATVTFRVLSAGDPKIRIEAADGRDAGNRKVAVSTSERLVTALPTVTRLAFAQPNPFRGNATLAFSLAQAGRVELAIYSVDGRLVRTLVSETREPGEYREVWDGRDDHGNPTSAGVFYAHLASGKFHQTRAIVNLK